MIHSDYSGSWIIDMFWKKEKAEPPQLFPFPFPFLVLLLVHTYHLFFVSLPHAAWESRPRDATDEARREPAFLILHLHIILDPLHI